MFEHLPFEKMLRACTIQFSLAFMYIVIWIHKVNFSFSSLRFSPLFESDVCSRRASPRIRPAATGGMEGHYPLRNHFAPLGFHRRPQCCRPQQHDTDWPVQPYTLGQTSMEVRERAILLDPSLYRFVMSQWMQSREPATQQEVNTLHVYNLACVFSEILKIIRYNS